jgi:hypothetical protein
LLPDFRLLYYDIDCHAAYISTSPLIYARHAAEITAILLRERGYAIIAAALPC